MLTSRIDYSGDIIKDIISAKGVDSKLIHQTEINYQPPQHIQELFNEFVVWNDDILVFADCDVDGLCSAAICKIYLEDVLNKSVYYKIVKRSRRGFQLQDAKEIIDEYPSCNTVLTVDCGTNATDAYNHLVYNGYNVFITDHHQLDTDKFLHDNIFNPVLDNRDLFKYFCGAGTIYLLFKSLFGDNECALQYAAIATVADLVPMLADNRVIVSDGLKSISNNNCGPIYDFLKRTNNLVLSEKDISWGIAPIVNSASRLNKEDVAFRAIVKNDLEATQELKNLNKQRKNIVANMIKDNDSNIVKSMYAVTLLIDGAGHNGLIGLVATQLNNKYNLPTLVAIKDGKKDKHHYSVRGILSGKFIEHVNNKYKNISGGGHNMAGGFQGQQVVQSLMQEFHDFHRDNYDNNLETGAFVQLDEPNADIKISFSELAKNYQLKNSLAPYGNSFSEPVFLSTVKLRHEGTTSSGKYNKYTVSCVDKPNYTATFVDFRNLIQTEINEDNKFDITYTVNYNIFYKGLEVGLTNIEQRVG